MALAKLKEKTARLHTVGEYLSLDRESIDRYQYLDGVKFIKKEQAFIKEIKNERI